MLKKELKEFTLTNDEGDLLDISRDVAGLSITTGQFFFDKGTLDEFYAELTKFLKEDD